MKNYSEIFFNINLHPLCVIDLNYKIRKVNNSFLKAVKCDKEKIRTKYFLDFIFEDDREKVKIELKNFAKRKKEKILQIRLIDKNNNIKLMDWSIASIPKEKAIFCSGRDVTKTQNYLNKLENLNKNLTELQSSNKDLENFAFIASHDLSEPLQHIEMLCDFLDEKYDKQYIERIRYSSRRARELINATLKYARVDSEKYKMEESDTNHLIEMACSDLEIGIKDSNAKIIYDNLPIIYCEPSQIVLLFKNLIGNSLKYRSREDPVITITCKDFFNYLIFCVHDNGLGVDQKYHEVVFEIFKRLNSDIEGTGIGLSLCKRIIEKHNGKIWLESDKGKGSSFYFMIPKKENWCPLEEDHTKTISVYDDAVLPPHVS